MSGSPPTHDGPSATNGSAGGFADGRACYLIVQHHVLVAQDIALTIADFDREASIIQVVARNEAEAALTPVARVAVAFVADAPRLYAGSPLDRAIAERGGRVVLMGREAEEEGAALGFEVLARPFTIDGVLSRLKGGVE